MNLKKVVQFTLFMQIRSLNALIEERAVSKIHSGDALGTCMKQIGQLVGANLFALRE